LSPDHTEKKGWDHRCVDRPLDRMNEKKKESNKNKQTKTQHSFFQCMSGVLVSCFCCSFLFFSKKHRKTQKTHKVSRNRKIVNLKIDCRTQRAAQCISSLLSASGSIKEPSWAQKQKGQKQHNN
jgi:hypothetical protein